MCKAQTSAKGNEQQLENIQLAAGPTKSSKIMKIKSGITMNQGWNGQQIQVPWLKTFWKSMSFHLPSNEIIFHYLFFTVHSKPECGQHQECSVKELTTFGANLGNGQRLDSYLVAQGALHAKQQGDQPAKTRHDSTAPRKGGSILPS